MHAGYAPRFYKYDAGEVRGILKGKPLVATHDAWRVTFAEASTPSTYGQPVVYADDIQRVRVLGRTWCVVVPHGFVVTRRALKDSNGTVVNASVPIIVHNCMLAHGAACSLREKLCENSDPHRTLLCAQCGLFADAKCVEPGRRIGASGTCRMCGTDSDVREVVIPYAFKLLVQEFQALHILTKFRFSDEVNHDPVMEPICEFPVS